ncbi:recombinase family protein [Guptibacillus hwajinpoensis]|uniref:recombinase family protein n=1 Tax=Guptibacillus hwajinpoensis TaxID=208199 RepID=UPI0024B3B3D7|nr:recombinase family protein [Pseudalkalibacillus hwajinpoensis]
MNTVPIKYVAIYLRKSRGDLEKDLTKHQQILTDIAEKSGWQYRVYSEIGSAENIEFRPIMKELLLDISNKLFDGVLVMDVDRLGRGDKSDQAQIESTFKNSSTFLVTPQKVFNFHNESDAMLSDVQGMLARFEYIQIKKRLNQGKKAGAKFGNWTNGPPPFPYYYDRQSKGLKVDESKRDIYLLLKQKVLNGEPLHSIAVEFNKKGFRTNRNKLWTDVALHRILTNEVHLGRVIYGKSTGSGHINKKTSPKRNKNRNEWIVATNAHEALLTMHEYSLLQSNLFKNKLIPKRARNATYPLTGLIKCGSCNASINFTRKRKKNYMQVIVKKCQKPDWLGNRCGNRGVKQETILLLLKKELENHLNCLSQSKTANKSRKDHVILNRYNEITKERMKYKNALERTRELYELGEYERDLFMVRSEKWHKKIISLDNEEDQLRATLEYSKSLNNNERINIINNVLAYLSIHEFSFMNFSERDAKLFNFELRKIVNKIYYTRNQEEIKFEVHYNI